MTEKEEGPKLPEELFKGAGNKAPKSEVPISQLLAEAYRQLTVARENYDRATMDKRKAEQDHANALQALEHCRKAFGEIIDQIARETKP